MKIFIISFDFHNLFSDIYSVHLLELLFITVLFFTV